MMMIQTTVRTSVIVQIREALTDLHISEMASWDVRVFGSEKGRKTSYRGSEYTEEFTRQVAIELVVADEQADRIVDTLARTLRTNGVTDAQILVLPVARSIRLGSVEEEHRHTSFQDVPRSRGFGSFPTSKNYRSFPSVDTSGDTMIVKIKVYYVKSEDGDYAYFYPDLGWTCHRAYASPFADKKEAYQSLRKIASIYAPRQIKVIFRWVNG